MDNGLILETTFLVDLERELTKGIPGPAQTFLEKHPNQHLYLAFTIAGELAAGVPVDERPRWLSLISPFEVLPSTDEVAWTYGQVFRYLKTNGLLIGANDLWIAASAVAFDKGLVTRNERDFRRVPGLRVVTYTP